MVVINQITNFRFGNSFFLGTIDNLNTIANVIPGIGVANKALVLDANNSINNINNISCSSITFGGINKSAASWLTTGIQFNTIPTTYTITDAPAYTTVASAVIRSFGGSSTISSTNANVIITNVASLYIGGTPLAGTNVTITNNYSLWIASGRILFGSNIASTSTTTGTLVITGGLGVSGSLYATSLSGTLLIAAQPNITSVGTLTGLTMGGVLAMGTNNITGTGNIGGTLSTVAQPNITSVGTLTSLAITGSLTVGGNVVTGSQLSYLSGITAGTVTASKVLVVDASSNIATINTLTVNNININTGFNFGGTNVSTASWLTTGIQLSTLSTTYTNNSTSISGTAATAVINSFAQCTIAATNLTVTTTNAATVYIANAPLAGTNMTLTNKYALWVAAGNVLFAGNLTVSGILSGILSTVAQPNITSVGTLTGLTMGGTLAMGTNNITGTGNIGGTLITVAQPNITSVGTLTGLTMGGTLAMGTNNITGTGNIGGTLTTVAQPNITSVGDLTDLTVNGISILNGSTGINKISTPGMQAEINSATGSCLRLSYNAPSSAATVYTDLKVSSVGNLKIATSGPSVLIGNTTNIVMPLELGTTTYTIPTSFGWLKSNGTIGSSASGTSTTYSLRANGRILCNTEIDVLSDARVKTNITSLDADFCKQFIINTVPVSYNFTHVEDEKTHYGYLAQDIIRAGYDQLVSIVPNETLQEVIDSDGFVSPAGKQLTLCYDEIIPILAKNISILYEENNQLKEQINTLMKLIKNKIE